MHDGAKKPLYRIFTTVVDSVVVVVVVTIINITFECRYIMKYTIASFIEWKRALICSVINALRLSTRIHFRLIFRSIDAPKNVRYSSLMCVVFFCNVWLLFSLINRNYGHKKFGRLIDAHHSRIPSQTNQWAHSMNMQRTHRHTQTILKTSRCNSYFESFLFVIVAICCKYYVAMFIIRSL